MVLKTSLFLMSILFKPTCFVFQIFGFYLGFSFVHCTTYVKKQLDVSFCKFFNRTVVFCISNPVFLVLKFCAQNLHYESEKSTLQIITKLMS